MTKQTNHKPGTTAAASAIAPDAYTRITNRIVADLEQGVRPWCKPWGGDQLGARITRPRRANGKPYAGINTLILWLEAVEKGHRSPTWMTYRQAQQLGGQVRRGERGSQVVYMGETTKTRRDEGTGEGTEQGARFLKTYTVFNVGQIDSLPEAFAIPAEAPCPALPCPAPSRLPTRRRSLPRPEPTSGMGARRPSTPRRPITSACPRSPPSAMPRAITRPSGMRHCTGLVTPRAWTGASGASAGAMRDTLARSWWPNWEPLSWLPTLACPWSRARITRA